MPRKDFTSHIDTMTDGELVALRDRYLWLMQETGEKSGYTRLYWAAEGELLRRSTMRQSQYVSDKKTYEKHDF